MLKKESKRAQAGFSFSTIIVIALIVVALILFLVLLAKVGGIASLFPAQKSTEKPFGLVVSDVYPIKGPIGTMFNIKASVEGKNASTISASIAGTEVYLHDDGMNGDSRKADGIFTGIFDSSKISSKGPIEGSVTASIPSTGEQYTGKIHLEISDNSCNPIIANGDTGNKIDLVFIGVNYSSSEKLDSDVKLYADTQGINQGIFSFFPFNSSESRFNIYSIANIFSLEDLGCVVGCHGVSTMVCCDDKKVEKAALDCPADQIILLIDSPDFCASSSYYSKICANDMSSPQVLVHEFGHSFGNLGDEYDYDVVPGLEKITDYNFPNCAKDCGKWADIPGTGCFPTCGYPEYYRSTDNSCIMKHLVDSFCPVCTQALQSLLANYDDKTIKESLPAAKAIFSNKKEYVVEFDYKSGKLSQQESYVNPSAAPDYKKYSGGYSMKIKSKDNKILYSANFTINTIEFPFFTTGSIRSEPLVTGEFNYTLKAPYFDNAKAVEVYNPQGSLINVVDVSYFSDTCGNSKCESYENYLSCPLDCKISEDNSCTPEQDGVCDANCKDNEDPDCKVKFWTYSLAILGGIIVLLGIILAVMKRRKR